MDKEALLKKIEASKEGDRAVEQWLVQAKRHLKEDREVVLAAVRKNGLALRKRCAGGTKDPGGLRQDPDVVWAAVQQNGFAAQHMEGKLRDDQQFIDHITEHVVRAIEGTHSENIDEVFGFVENAPPRLQTNKEVAMAAVQKDPEVLQLLGPRAADPPADPPIPDLRKNREVVLAAVKKSGMALVYADDSLMGDLDVAKAAVEQDWNALKHLDPKLNPERDPEVYKKLLMIAVAQGVDLRQTRKLTRCKVVIVGDGRVGKTSLILSLQGEEFQEEMESTCGMDSMTVDVCQVQAGESRGLQTSWKRVAQGDDDTDEKLAAAALEASPGDLIDENVPGISPEMTDRQYLDALGLQHIIMVDLNNFAPVQGGIRPNIKAQGVRWVESRLKLTDAESKRFRKGLRQLTKGEFEEYDLFSKAKSILDKQGKQLSDDTPTMMINDLAGQRMYYILHQLLLTVALTQYVVVVSMEHELDTPLADEEDQVFGMTHGENLDFWLSSIFGRCPTADILLVCTKLDLVSKETKEDRLEALEAFLKGKVYEDCIRHKVCVSSKTGDGVDDLRWLLRASIKPLDPTDGTGLLRYGEKVPLGWFRFQALATKLVGRGERRISLAQARELAKECGVVDEKECGHMLLEFANLGQIIWHDTPQSRELVVLDVQWFMDRMTDVLCKRSIRKHQKEAASKRMRSLWNALDRGRLSPQLLPVLWPKLSESEWRSMLASMATFGFVSRLSEQAVEEQNWPYIVPSLLPAVPQDRAIWKPSEEHDRSLRICFIHQETQDWSDGQGFLPDTLFFRVVSALVQDATSIRDAFRDLYIDRMVVRGDQRFMVCHLRQQRCLELTVFGKDQPGAYSAVALHLKKILLAVHGSFGVQFRYEIECEYRGEDGWWSVLDLPPDHELRQLWIQPEPELDAEPAQANPVCATRVVVQRCHTTAYRTCLDRELVQKEIGWQEQYQRPVVTVYEDEQLRQAHFDYSKAWAKYRGTQYERLLNIDSIVYRRDMDEAEVMVNRILRKARASRPETTGTPINHPGKWDFFLCYGRAAAGDQVNSLCFLLRKKGKTVWYYNEMEHRSTAAIAEGVKQSAHFLMFLSGDPVIVEQTARVLLFTCSSADTGNETNEIRPSQLKETRTIERLFDQSRFRYDTRVVQSWEDLYNHLANMPAEVLHMSGHGEERSLVFENEAGKLEQPDKGHFARKVVEYGAQCVVINACHSATIALEIHKLALQGGHNTVVICWDSAALTSDCEKLAKTLHEAMLKERKSAADTSSEDACATDYAVAAFKHVCEILPGVFDRIDERGNVLNCLRICACKSQLEVLTDRPLAPPGPVDSRLWQYDPKIVGEWRWKPVLPVRSDDDRDSWQLADDMEVLAPSHRLPPESDWNPHPAEEPQQRSKTVAADGIWWPRRQAPRAWTALRQLWAVKAWSGGLVLLVLVLAFAVQRRRQRLRR